jgi:hypothetical protein
MAERLISFTPQEEIATGRLGQSFNEENMMEAFGAKKMNYFSYGHNTGWHFYVLQRENRSYDQAN